MTYLAMLAFQCACSIYSQFFDKHLAGYKKDLTIDRSQNLLEYNSLRNAYVFEVSNWRQWNVQLRQGFTMKTATMGTPLELQHLEYVAEFSETLLPSCLQSNCHVNCMVDGNWVHCTEVLKVM